MTLGELIKNKRLEKGLTQRELGMLIGYDGTYVTSQNGRKRCGAQDYIANYETGRRKPGAKILLQICKALDIDISEVEKFL